MLAWVLLLAACQLDGAPPEVPDEPVLQPRVRQSSGADMVATRAAWSVAAGVAGAGAGLGIALLFDAVSQSSDVKFTAAALSALLVAGAAITVHEALGGRGEVVLAVLGAALVMAGSAVLANAIDGGVPRTPILTAAIGGVPAAVLAVVGLEITAPAAKKARIAVFPSPGGVVVAF